MTFRYHPHIKIPLFLLLIFLSSFFIYHKHKEAEASGSFTNGNPCSVSMSNFSSTFENWRCINSTVPATQFAANVAGSWSMSGGGVGDGYVVSCILDPTGIDSNCNTVGSYTNLTNTGPNGFGLGCLGFGCTFGDLTLTARNTVTLFADQDIQAGCNDPTATNYRGVGFCTYYAYSESTYVVPKYRWSGACTCIQDDINGTTTSSTCSGIPACYVYSQSTYYTYSQSTYYVYSQSAYILPPTANLTCNL